MLIKNRPFVSSPSGLGLIGMTLLITYTIVWYRSAPEPVVLTTDSGSTSAAPAGTVSSQLDRSIASSRTGLSKELGEGAARTKGRVHALPFGGSTQSSWTPDAIRSATGAEAVRGRGARFFSDSILTHPSGFALRMNLFPDTVLVAIFQPPSVLETNSKLYAGTIEGDPEGDFRLFVDEQKVSGIIHAFKKTYQLIPLNESSHLIIELQPQG